MEPRPVIAVTMGDPCGIGPEIIIRAAARYSGAVRLLVAGDPGVMTRASAICGIPLKIVEAEIPPEAPDRNVLYVRPTSHIQHEHARFGDPSPEAGDAAFRAIVEAAGLCMSGKAAAMATAPINKEVLNRAGHRYPGHTELLAELTGTEKFVMMLAGPKLRVSLVTIHEALAKVPALITRERILDTVRITSSSVDRYFRPRPRIAVLALNPHCGEAGLFGDEEAKIIGPAVADARREGIDAVGPLSADTLFHFAAAGDYDAVVCMYHDQGLIPLKLLHFDDGVNITLGLPIIRTSVDHGTAYPLAGTGSASESSMAAAITTAVSMAATAASRQS